MIFISYYLLVLLACYDVPINHNTISPFVSASTLPNPLGEFRKLCLGVSFHSWLLIFIGTSDSELKGTSSNRVRSPSPTRTTSPSLTIPAIVNVHRRFSTFLGIPTIAPTSASIPLSDDESDAPGRETNPPGETDSNGNGNGNANSNANGNANGNGKGNDKDNGKGHSKLKPVPKGKDKGNAVDIHTTITGTDILTDIGPSSPTSTPSDGAIAFSDSANIVVSTFTPLPVTTLVTVTQSDSSRILEASATVQSVLASAARRCFGGVGLGLPGRALDVVGVRVALVGTVIALMQIML